jgi:hypothetical protein
MTETLRRAKALLAAGWTNPEPTLWELDTDDPRWATSGRRETATGEDFEGATTAAYAIQKHREALELRSEQRVRTGGLPLID